MKANVAEKRIHAVAGDRLLLAMRDIGRPWTDRRLMRVALIGRSPALHTLPVLSVEPKNALAAAALLNSMTFDFLVRLHIPGGHVAPWVVSQCAAPGPSALRTAEVLALAAELSVTSQSLATATERTLHAWDNNRRILIDARLDALVARAYQLNRKQYELVLDHFSVLRRAEEANYHEYRSKRLRLEAFDDLGGSA